MTLRTTLAGVALASLLTGCGGPGGKATDAASPTAGASTSHDVATLWRQYAQCLRQHGAPNYPDPVQGTDGSWGPPLNAPRPPRTAINACRSSGGNLKAQMQREQRPLTAAEVGKLRQFAQCLRQHGLPDWPDPKADGSFAVPPRLRHVLKTPGQPALNACRQYITGPIRTSGA
jgi:hypothetical protein